MTLNNKETVDIIIATYDNGEQLVQCIESMLFFRKMHPVRIIVVNNGTAKIENQNKEVLVINTGKNLGWEGGLKEGLKYSKSKYVMFANDDIFIPTCSMYWMRDMVRYMDAFPIVGAIGPASNLVMGSQCIFNEPKVPKFDTSFLIGFCILLRREVLDKVGGVDTTLSGGDDIDLSIRLRKAGYKLIVRKDIFVWHYGFQTGEKLHGTPDKPGGWNSREMGDETNLGLIRKHGLKDFIYTMYPSMQFPDEIIHDGVIDTDAGDIEGNLIKEYVKSLNLKSPTIADVGCGANKTIKESIGIDIVPKGEIITELQVPSVADIVGNAEDPLPMNNLDVIIARHILEHCLDTVRVLKNWVNALKAGGKLIIALPNEDHERTIVLNPEHIHAFNPESINNILELLKLKKVKTMAGESEYSFVTIYEKEAK